MRYAYTWIYLNVLKVPYLRSQVTERNCLFLPQSYRQGYEKLMREVQQMWRSIIEQQNVNFTAFTHANPQLSSQLLLLVD